MASRGGSGCGEKLVALDFRGDADMPVGIRLDAHDLAATTDIDFGALRNLFGKGQDKFDFGAHLKLRFGEKVESLIADVAGLGAELAAARFAREHSERQTHGKSPGYAPFRTISHTTPDRVLDEIMPNGTPRRDGKQSEIAEILS
jgi:hypothetical protein